MASINEFLISGIIVVLSIVYTKIIFRQSDLEDIDIKKELENWKGSKENFIEFKKFEYTRTFSLINEIQPVMIFALTIALLELKEMLIPLVGVIIYLSLIIAVLIPLGKLIKVLGFANKKAINNMKRLYLSS